MPWPTTVRVHALYHLPDGSAPWPTSRVSFQLTHQLTDSATGGIITRSPIVAHLDSAGRLVDPGDNQPGVRLAATNDPTTHETGVAYAVMEYLIPGQEPRSVSPYYLTLAYDGPADVELGTLPHGTAVPGLIFGLTDVTVPAPLVESLAAGVAAIRWDTTGAAVGDVPTLQGLGPDVVGWTTPGGGWTAHSVQADFTCAEEPAAIYLCDTDPLDDTITATLPAPTAGRLVLLVMTGQNGNPVALAPSGGALVNGQTDLTVLSNADDTEALIADGTNWTLQHGRLDVRDSNGGQVLGVNGLYFTGGAVDVSAGANGEAFVAVAVPPRANGPPLADVAGGAAGTFNNTSRGDHQHALADAYLATAANLSDVPDPAAALAALGAAAAADLSAEASTRAADDSTHAALTTPAHGGIVADTDSRLTDARTPTAHTHTHASTTGQTVDDHHAQSHAHSGSDGSGTVAHSSLSGIRANDHHAQIHVVSHATGQADALTPAAIGASATGHTHAESDTTGLVSDLAGKAVPNADNAFSVKQGIRAAAGTHADGLYVPWITGDTHAALVAGSAGAGSNQIAVEGDTESGTGVLGAAASGTGVEGTSGTGIALAGTFASTTDTNNIISVAQLRHRTTQTPVAGFGTGVRLIANSDTVADRNQALLAAAWSDPADATRSSYLALYTALNGSLLERLRIGPTGATAIRSTTLSTAAGLSVPWISGDAAPALVAGASTSGNTQVGVSGISDSNSGVQGQAASGSGVVGLSATGAAVQGLMSGAGVAALDGRYTGSGVGITTVLTLRNRSTGSIAAGTGLGLAFLSKSSTTNDRSQALLTTQWVVATEAAQTARAIFSVYDTVAREAWRAEASGTAPMIGFLGSAAQAKPTISGSRGANAALASLLTALAAYGLITDSTS